MNNEKEYQKEPQSEEELKATRAIKSPDIVRGEEPQTISVISNEIIGIEYCEEELKDRKDEEYQHRKFRSAINEEHVLRMLEAKATEVAPITEVAPATAEKLIINQIALMYVYEGKGISRKESDEIVRQHGHTSGEKLFQRFTFYSSSANRKAKPFPFTQKRLKNKIELFSSVIQLLPKDKQAKALDEVKILNTFFKTEDE